MEEIYDGNDKKLERFFFRKPRKNVKDFILKKCQINKRNHYRRHPQRNYLIIKKNIFLLEHEKQFFSDVPKAIIEEVVGRIFAEIRIKCINKLLKKFQNPRHLRMKFKSNYLRYLEKYH